MSNFGFSNLASLARSKLHSALSSSTRDNGSLHRWVLLKNSILYNHNDDSRTPVIQKDVYEDDYTEEDCSDPLDEYEDVFSFLFPDPGDSSLESVDDLAISEAQWLDSLLESLGQDEDQDDVESNGGYSGGDICRNQVVSDISRTILQKSGDDMSARVVIDYPTPYPPLHPPLVQRYNPSFYTDSPCSSITSSDSNFSSSPFASPRHGGSETYLYIPDATEDASDDETEGPTTPFSRSRSSLHLYDPAIVSDQCGKAQVKSQPYVYNEAEGAFFHPFQIDSLPYANNYASFHSACQYS